MRICGGDFRCGSWLRDEQKQRPERAYLEALTGAVLQAGRRAHDLDHEMLIAGAPRLAGRLCAWGWPEGAERESREASHARA